jgi:hypothetical protein
VTPFVLGNPARRESVSTEGAISVIFFLMSLVGKTVWDLM